MIYFGIVLLLSIFISIINISVLTNYANKDIAGYVIFYKTIVLIWIFFAVSLFFMRKKNAPKVIMGLMVSNIVFPLIGLILFINKSYYSEYIVLSVRELISSSIFGAIWIPYFIFSNRVKRTFLFE